MILGGGSVVNTVISHSGTHTSDTLAGTCFFIITPLQISVG